MYRWWKYQPHEDFDPSQQREIKEWLEVIGETMRYPTTQEQRLKMIEILLSFADNPGITTRQRIAAMDQIRKLEQLNLEYEKHEAATKPPEDDRIEVIDEEDV